MTKEEYLDKVHQKYNTFKLEVKKLSAEYGSSDVLEIHKIGSKKVSTGLEGADFLISFEIFEEGKSS